MTTESTTKETVLTLSNFSEGMGNPITLIVPDKIVEQYIEVPVPVPAPDLAVDFNADPCPYCSVFVTLPTDVKYDSWFQCGNCGEIFFARKEGFGFWLRPAETAKTVYDLDAPSKAPLVEVSPVNDNYGPNATQYKAVALALAAVQDETFKAANFGAKAGETIAGNLKRGSNGKFTGSGGSSAFGGLGTDASGLDEVKRRVAAMNAPKGKGGKGKKAAAKKGGKAKAPKKTKDEKQAEKDKNRTANLTKAFGDDGFDEALSNVRDDPTTKLNDEYQKKLEDAGLIRTNSNTGLTTLTSAGKSAMRAAENNDVAGLSKAKKIGQANAKANKTAADKKSAAKTASDQKKAAAAAKREANKKAVADRKTAAAAKREQSKKDRAAKLRQRADQIETSKEYVEQVVDETGPVAVFKQVNGVWRWIAFTSSSFEDRDREIVTQKAIEADVQRADLDGNYGPIRWGHIPGFDIGMCDFNMVLGHILVESGTFFDEAVAVAVHKNAANLELSAGFLRPRNEPIDGVYHTFKRFERSLLIRGDASNVVTEIQMLRGNSMATLEEKIAQFKQLLGGGAEADQIATSVVDRALTVNKAALGAGLVHKEAGEGAAASGEVVETDNEETEESDDPSENFVGDMTQAEFIPFVAAIVRQAVPTAQAGEVVTKEFVADAIRTAMSELPATKAVGQVAALEETIKSLSGKLDKALSSLADLTGDQPRIMRGYVASSSNENIVSAETVKAAAPKMDDIDTAAANAARAIYGG